MCVCVCGGDINIHIDSNMNIDIHIIINMHIENYKSYYLLASRRMAVDREFAYILFVCI